MNNGSGCKCCDPRSGAVALGRWCIGMLFLFFGIGKVVGGVSGFAEGMVKQFEKTWLPQVLVNIFGHSLPFLEVLVGLLLLLGLFRNVALFGTGVLLLLLTFGQVVLGQPQVVFFNTCYVFLTAALLFAANYDCCVLFPRRRSEAPST